MSKRKHTSQSEKRIQQKKCSLCVPPITFQTIDENVRHGLERHSSDHWYCAACGANIKKQSLDVTFDKCKNWKKHCDGPKTDSDTKHKKNLEEFTSFYNKKKSTQLISTTTTSPTRTTDNRESTTEILESGGMELDAQEISIEPTTPVQPTLNTNRAPEDLESIPETNSENGRNTELGQWLVSVDPFFQLYYGQFYTNQINSLKMNE